MTAAKQDLVLDLYVLGSFRITLCKWLFKGGSTTNPPALHYKGKCLFKIICLNAFLIDVFCLCQDGLHPTLSHGLTVLAKKCNGKTFTYSPNSRHYVLSEEIQCRALTGK